MKFRKNRAVNYLSQTYRPRGADIIRIDLDIQSYRTRLNVIYEDCKECAFVLKNPKCGAPNIKAVGRLMDEIFESSKGLECN